jgi:hypothetical protein
MSFEILRRELVAEWVSPLSVDLPRKVWTGGQYLVKSVDEIYPLLDQRQQPLGITVCNFRENGEVKQFDRLFFDIDLKGDLDGAWTSVKRLSDDVYRRYRIRGLIVFSGQKGYHLHILMRKPFGEGYTDQQIKEVYTELQRLLRGAGEYPGFDPAVMNQHNRIHRLPLSYHQATGELVHPVNEDRQKVMPLEGFMSDLRRCGVQRELVDFALKRIEDKKTRLESERGSRQKREYSDELRPCMKAILDLTDTHAPRHILKVAAVCEALSKGWSELQIVGKFASMSGYNEKITKSQIASIRGRKPFRCATIRQYGGCLLDCPQRDRKSVSRRCVK